LKLVFERNGLSGIIILEQDEVKNKRRQLNIMQDFQVLNMASKIPVIAKEQKHEIGFLTNQ
jgi:hypothetical protein